MGLGAQKETKPEYLESVVLNENFHESVGLAHNGLLPVTAGACEEQNYIGSPQSAASLLRSIEGLA